MGASGSADLVVRVAANISALQADMKGASDSIKGTTESWQGFVKDFDLESTISHPLETAKQAAGAFAAELGPASVAALATAASVAAVGVALFELTERAAAVGGRLNDLSEKSGMSVPALSKLSLAAQVAGSDVDTLSSALFMLQRNIGEDSPKMEAGLKKIGLTLAELKAGGVDNYLITIAHHFKETEDPAARAAAAMELFNRQGREIIPTLLKLDEALEQTNDIAPWTEEQAREAEHFEMQMKSIKIHVEAFSLAIGRDFIGPVSSFVAQITSATSALADFFGGVGGKLTPIYYMAEGWRYAATALDTFSGAAEKVPTITGDAAAGVKKMHERIAALAIHVPTLTEALALQASATKDLEADQKQLTEARRIEGEAVKLLAEIEKTTFGLAMEHQKQWRDEILKTKNERNQQVTDGLKQIQSAEAATADFIHKTVLDSQSYQILKIWERVDEEEKSFKGSEAQRASYNAAVEALATEQAQVLRDTADAAASATEASALRQVAAVKTVIGSYWEQIDAAAQAAGVAVVGHRPGEPGSEIHAGASPNATGSIAMQGGGPTDPRVLAFTSSGYTLGEAMAKVGGYGASIMPHFDTGGPVLSDGPIYAHAGEYVVPKSGGGSSGGGVTNIFNTYVTQPLATSDAIARALGDSVMARLRSLGVRG